MSLTIISLTQLDPKATKFGEITQNNGYYAVQGHSRSPILVPILSPYAKKWIIPTYILSRTVYKVIAGYCNNISLSTVGTSI